MKAARVSSRERFARNSCTSVMSKAAVRLTRVNETVASSVATTNVCHLACDGKVSHHHHHRCYCHGYRHEF